MTPAFNQDELTNVVEQITNSVMEQFSKDKTPSSENNNVYEYSPPQTKE